MRPFGQTTISSFLAKPRSLEEGKEPEPLRPSISKTSESDLTKVGKRTIKVKKNAFSSVRSTRNNPNNQEEKGNATSVLSEAIFKQFSCSAVRKAHSLGIEKDEDQSNMESQVRESEIESCFDSNKRNNPFGKKLNNSTPRLLVLGDDPKPQSKPKKRKLASIDNREKPFYNHYANGRGWLDGDMEGIDYEEVGWDQDMWEGMGSITFGGPNWN